MQRIQALDPEAARGKSKQLFTAVQNQLGLLPNMIRTMGNSPAVLSAYLSLSATLGESSIGPILGEQIAITVAEANGCSYCIAAHSFLGQKFGLIDAATIELTRQGRLDGRTQAALNFVKVLADKKGRVSDADMNTLKAVGFDDTAVAEIIAHTVLNIFTNYFNIAANTEVDFPKVELAESATHY
jgi:uncharacterized peroxidase-related enzyme